MKCLLGILSLTALLGGYATPLTAREKEALGGGALGALGGAAVGDQMESQNQRQDIQAYEADQQRRAIEWQRRELEDLRRDGYDDRGYDSRPNDRDYNRVSAVRNTLIQAGVPAAKIQTGTFGDAQLTRDRRVEVLIRTSN
jgi:hypothetical protein